MKSICLHVTIGVATGGAAGAVVRWLTWVWLARALPAGGGVLATFVVNMIGCLLIGYLKASAARHGISQVMLSALAIGFLGSLTTFSTFSHELVTLGRWDDIWAAIGYGCASLTCGILLVVLGMKLGAG